MNSTNATHLEDEGVFDDTPNSHHVTIYSGNKKAIPNNICSDTQEKIGNTLHSNPRKICRENIRDLSKMEAALKQFSHELDQVEGYDFYETIQSLERGESIGYEKAFLGFLYVVASNNSFVKERLFPNKSLDLITKRAVLLSMSMRFLGERGKISGAEIAGMIAATRLDLTYNLSHQKSVTEMCGMGGDIGFGNSNLNADYQPLREKIQVGFAKEASVLSEGAYYEFIMNEIIIPDRAIKQRYKTENKKSVNISTLSSLAVGSLGYTIMKHGSSGNTSKVGSSDAIIQLGIPLTFQTREEIEQIFADVGFIYTDAVVSKTIHDLSGNILKTETVNHLTGPMTPPLDPSTKLNKVLGINHNIHPNALGEAYEIIAQKGIYNIGNVLIVGGFADASKMEDPINHKNICLDEFSPQGSILGVIINGTFHGIFTISEEDFGVKICMENVLIGNEHDGRDIYAANEAVINGSASQDLINLVACNVALGIIVSNGSMNQPDFIQDGKINTNYLRSTYSEALAILSSLQVPSYIERIKESVKKASQNIQ